MENERVLAPDEINLARTNPIGPGSRSMSNKDFFVLYIYILYWQEPACSLKRLVFILCGTLFYGTVAKIMF